MVIRYNIISNGTRLSIIDNVPLDIVLILTTVTMNHCTLTITFNCLRVLTTGNSTSVVGRGR